MLMKWRELVVNSDPDIITGYNCINFDLNYLIIRSEKLKIEGFKRLCRFEKKWRSEKPASHYFASVKSDPNLLRAATYASCSTCMSFRKLKLGRVEFYYVSIISARFLHSKAKIRDTVLSSRGLGTHENKEISEDMWM